MQHQNFFFFFFSLFHDDKQAFDSVNLCVGRAIRWQTACTVISGTRIQVPPEHSVKFFQQQELLTHF